VASNFPPFVASDISPAVVMGFTPDTDATFKTGGFVVYDPTDATIDGIGSDPAAILGIALADVAVGVIAAGCYADGKVPVLCLRPSTVIGMASATTPAEAHVLVAGGGYGMVVSATSGYWLVDISETTAKNLSVVRVDIPNGVFYVQFHGDHLQLESAAGALT